MHSMSSTRQHNDGDPDATMTAVQFRRYGGPEVLDVVKVARPQPDPDGVLIAVEASSVNPHDAVVRSGNLKIVTGRRLPLGLGLDFAGTVVATGADVDPGLVGTRVWGMVSPQTGHVTGAAAAYVAVPAQRVAPVPAGLSMPQAASLVTAGTTALRALRGIGHVQPEQRVLIRGGGGGVGITAVQLAHALGAHVTALAGADQLDFVADLGADEALDYRTVTPDDLDEFDVIFDTVGTDLLAYRRRLRGGGKMITIAFGSGSAMASIGLSTVFGAKRIRTFSNYPDHALLVALAGFVASGAIRPVIDATYPLSRIADAHRALDSRGRTGKLVLVDAEFESPATISE